MPQSFSVFTSPHDFLLNSSGTYGASLQERMAHFKAKDSGAKVAQASGSSLQPPSMQAEHQPGKLSWQGSLIHLAQCEHPRLGLCFGADEAPFTVLSLAAAFASPQDTMAEQIGREQGSSPAILSALPASEASDAAHPFAGNSGSAAAVGNQHDVPAELPKVTKAELYSDAENSAVWLKSCDDAEDGIREVAAATPGAFSNSAEDVSVVSAAAEPEVIDIAATMAVAAEVQTSSAGNYTTEQISEEVQTSFVAEATAESQTSFFETSLGAVSAEAQTSFVAEATAEAQTSFVAEATAESQTSFFETSPCGVSTEAQTSFVAEATAESQTSFFETSPCGVSTEAQTSFVAEATAESQTSFFETSPCGVSTEAQTSFVAEATAESQTSFVAEATAESQTSFFETSPCGVSTEAQTSFVAEATAESQTSFVAEATTESQTSFVAEATAEVQTSEVLKTSFVAEATTEVQTAFVAEVTEEVQKSSFVAETSPEVQKTSFAAEATTEVQKSLVAEVSAEPAPGDSRRPSGGGLESSLPRESHEGDDPKGLADAVKTEYNSAAHTTEDSNASNQESHTNAIAYGMKAEPTQDCTEGVDILPSAKYLVDSRDAADSDSDDSFEPTASIINPWSDLTLDTSFEATQDKSQILNRLGPAAARSSLRASDDFSSPRWTSQQLSGKSKEPTATFTTELHTEDAAVTKPGASSKAAAAAVLAPVNETGASDESSGLVAEPELEAATGSPEAAPLSPTASTVYLDCETPKSCISSQVSYKSFPSSPWASRNTAPSSPLGASAAAASDEDQQDSFCVKATEASATIGTILWCFGLQYKQAVWMLKEPMETVRLCVFFVD